MIIAKLGAGAASKVGPRHVFRLVPETCYQPLDGRVHPDGAQQKHLPGLANRSIIPPWGPCPKAGLWGPQPQFICSSLRDRLDISTEVVYDSGIVLATGRVGRAHRRSDYP